MRIRTMLIVVGWICLPVAAGYVLGLNEGLKRGKELEAQASQRAMVAAAEALSVNRTKQCVAFWFNDAKVRHEQIKRAFCKPE